MHRQAIDATSHAIEQASRRWRGGRRCDSARTGRKILISTQVLGFSIDSVAERRGNKLLVTFIGAANCWGLRSLSQGNPLARPPLVNDFGAKVRRLYGNQNLTACSPRYDLVKNYRVHPTHWLISTQAATKTRTTSSA